jgi:hypothetical protein
MLAFLHVGSMIQLVFDGMLLSTVDIWHGLIGKNKGHVSSCSFY